MAPCLSHRRHRRLVGHAALHPVGAQVAIPQGVVLMKFFPTELNEHTFPRRFPFRLTPAILATVGLLIKIEAGIENAGDQVNDDLQAR